MKTYLNEHKKLHTGQMLYLCIQCEKRFAAKRYLSEHHTVHSGKYILDCNTQC